MGCWRSSGSGGLALCQPGDELLPPCGGRRMAETMVRSSSVAVCNSRPSGGLARTALAEKVAHRLCGDGIRHELDVQGIALDVQRRRTPAAGRCRPVPACHVRPQQVWCIRGCTRRSPTDRQGVRPAIRRRCESDTAGPWIAVGRHCDRRRRWRCAPRGSPHGRGQRPPIPDRPRRPVRPGRGDRFPRLHRTPR